MPSFFVHLISSDTRTNWFLSLFFLPEDVVNSRLFWWTSQTLYQIHTDLPGLTSSLAVLDNNHKTHILRCYLLSGIRLIHCDNKKNLKKGLEGWPFSSAWTETSLSKKNPPSAHLGKRCCEISEKKQVPIRRIVCSSLGKNSHLLRQLC